MIRTRTSRLALVLAALAAGGVICSGAARADMRVVSSDVTSRFLALGVSKSVVIEFSADIKNVVVADRTIASAVALSRRRVEVIGAGLGQTNIYFFDDHDRLLGGLDVAIKDTAQPHGLEDYPYPASVVMVTYGGGPNGIYSMVPLSCTPYRCLDARKPGADQPPGTENININSNNPTGVNVNAGR
jgi:putative type II/III system pilus formation protein